MRKRINNIISITGVRNFQYLIILFFCLIILSVFEFIGIGSIPIFISIILDSSILTSKVDIPELTVFLESHTKSELILYASIIIILIFLIKNLFYIFIVYFQGKLTKRIKLYLSYKLYNKYLNLNYISLFEKNSAVLIRSLTLDVGNTSIFILEIINLVRESAVFVGICILLFLASPYIALTMFIVFGIICYLFFLNTHKKIFSQGKSLQILSSDKIKIINNTIGSIREIKVFKLENFLKNKFFDNSNKFEIFAFRNYFIKLMPRVILEIFAVLGIVLLVMSFVLSDQDITALLPLLSLIVVSIIRIMPGLNLIQNSISTLKTIMPSYNYIQEQLKNYQNDSFLEKEKKNVSFKENISLSDISFRYPNNEKNVLNKINININKGDKLGIVGKSGSGKTTMINMLLGLIHPTEGDIYIDNKKIDFFKYEWKNIIGYVPQDIFLLEDTIKNNITFGIEKTNIDEELVKNVCKQAQIYDFVMSLPHDLNTLIGERGYNLSAGQRQRLGIARVLYRRPDLLILDESTSSLDNETEKKFIDDVFKSSKEKTIIFISHKLDALKNCNKIYDLNKMSFIEKKNDN